MPVPDMSKRRPRAHFSPSDRGKLVRLGDILPQMFAQYGLQRRNDNDALLEAWAAVVAALCPSYAKVTQVVGFQRGTLEIAVPHNAFAQELSFVQAELLAEMQKIVPDRKIRKMKFVIVQ